MKQPYPLSPRSPLPSRPPKTLFFPEMNTKLKQASQSLPFVQFRQLFQSIVKKCIKRSETDLSNKNLSSPETLEYLTSWLQHYGASPELEIRLLMLQAQILYREIPQQSLNKLNKVKHLVVDTKFEYLLPKIFFVESKIFQHLKQIQMRFKALKKSIEYGENYVVEYLKESNEARLELADIMIICYFQMYKYAKKQTPEAYDPIIHTLNKAYKAALKNYGSQHFSTLSILQSLQQQKKLVSSLHKIQPPKPLTEICSASIKKHTHLHILYNWQQELLVIMIKKTKKNHHNNEQVYLEEGEEKVVAESYHPIKLDMNSIKNIKNVDYNEYLEIGANYQITVYQQELNNIVVKNSVSHNNISLNHHTNTNIEKKGNTSMLKPFSRQQLIKGDTERMSSSSSDDEDILGQQRPNFLCLNNNTYSMRSNTTRHLPSTNHSGSKSKDSKFISKK